MMKKLLAAILVCGLVCSGISLAAESLVKVGVSADTMIIAGSNKNKNYGTSTSINVGGGPGTLDARIGLVRFEAETIPEPGASRVLLNLYCTRSKGDEVLYFGISGENKTAWAETEITYSSAPEDLTASVGTDGAGYIGTMALTSASVGAWVQFDVTEYALAQTDGVYAFRLTAPTVASNTATTNFASNNTADSTQHPYLSFDYNEYSSVICGADTMIRNGANADKAYDGINYVQLGDPGRFGLFRFDTADVDLSGVNYVSLDLTVKRAPSGSLDLFCYGLGEPFKAWEETITGGQAEESGLWASEENMTAAAVIKGLEIGDTVGIDVTDYVLQQQDGICAFKISTSREKEAERIDFYTREQAGSEPTLTFHSGDSGKAFADLAKISLPRVATEDFELPETGSNGSTIRWTSDNAAVSAEGVVTRPDYEAGDVQVILTANATCGSAEQTRSFLVTVPRRLAGGILQFSRGGILLESLSKGQTDISIVTDPAAETCRMVTAIYRDSDNGTELVSAQLVEGTNTEDGKLQFADSLTLEKTNGLRVKAFLIDLYSMMPIVKSAELS